MARIESEIAHVKNSSERLFNFMSNLNNFKHLMPPDKVVNWVSTMDECSFTITGMADMSMRITEKVPYTSITITPGVDNKSPFRFNLICQLTEVGEKQTDVKIIFDVELNAMMEMMVKKPLQNFVNLLAAKLAEQGDKL